MPTALDATDERLAMAAVRVRSNGRRSTGQREQCRLHGKS